MEFVKCYELNLYKVRYLKMTMYCLIVYLNCLCNISLHCTLITLFNPHQPCVHFLFYTILGDTNADVDIFIGCEYCVFVLFLAHFTNYFS